MESTLEPPDQHITLTRAAQLAGVEPGTLRRQVYRGKLRAQKFGRDLVTTRQWLHEYLINRDGSRGGQPAALPDGYGAAGEIGHMSDGQEQ